MDAEINAWIADFEYRSATGNAFILSRQAPAIDRLPVASILDAAAREPAVGDQPDVGTASVKFGNRAGQDRWQGRE